MLTRDEFRDTMQRLYSTTDAGFKSIASELHDINERMTSVDIARAELVLRVTQLERTQDAPPATAKTSLGEKGLAATGLLLLIASLKFLTVAGQFGLDAVKSVAALKLR